jgi:hypothetical protein
VAQVWGLRGLLSSAGVSIHNEVAALVNELPLAAAVLCDAEGRPASVRLFLGGAILNLPVRESA